MDIRVGNGFDTHPLIKGESLILGGVEIPSDLGIIGHSDGDVLIHSIMDSLLGSISKRDIGHHFPSSNSELKDIQRFKLLQHVNKIVKEEGYKILNIDSTIISLKDSPHDTKKISKHIKDNFNKVCDDEKKYLFSKGYKILECKTVNSIKNENFGYKIIGDYQNIQKSKNFGLWSLN